MADAPKRRKLERVQSDVPSFTGIQKFYCCRCGTPFSRQKGYFPISHSPMYQGTKYLPFCNDCVDAMYEGYKEKLGEKEAVYRMCMKLDLYWSENIFDIAKRSAGINSLFRTYIGKSNIVRYIDKSFDDTIDELGTPALVSQDTAQAEPAADAEVGQDGNEDVPEELVARWGAGYTLDFYAELERKYSEWTAGLTNLNQSECALYKQICLSEVLIARDAAKGLPIKDNQKQLNELLGSMNLKPSQQRSDAEAELDRLPLGVGLEKWESKRPLPETEASLRDVNHRIRDITTWYLGHGAKMVNLRGAHVQMYDEAMERLRVKFPEYEDEDDDTMLTDIFGNSKLGGADD